MYESKDKSMLEALRQRRGKSVSMELMRGEDDKPMSKDDDLAPSKVAVGVKGDISREGPLDTAQPRSIASTRGVHPPDPVRPDHPAEGMRERVVEAGDDAEHKSEDYAHMPGDIKEVMAEMDSHMIDQMADHERELLAKREPRSLGERVRKFAMSRMEKK